MPCFIAIIKVGSFEEAIRLVDYISNIPGNPMKSKKKHLVVMSPTFSHRLLQNKTSTFNVHFISPAEEGRMAIRSTFVLLKNIH